ncbi:MAG: 3'(2'),5'-bisphosphate nucleotidase CysQ [Thalassobaculaceae bacterium]
MSYSGIIDDLVEIAFSAGNIILRFYDDQFSIMQKSDGSPVTAADQAAEDYIIPALTRLTPDIPIVAEERVAMGQIPDVSGGTFWLVDPLDGTKEFINRNGDFTVNIGLIQSGIPTLGVVSTPVDKCAWAGSLADGALKIKDGVEQKIGVRKANQKKITVVASRSHRSPELEAFISELKVEQSISRGSSLKFCLIAEGNADIYPRTGPTMEWDTAAGHAVLIAAGGKMTGFDGTQFQYAKTDFLNGWFIASGK